VKTLLLSGLPLEPFDEIVRRQVAEMPDLARAVDACDWSTMKQRMGVSCGYLRDAGARPSGFTMFERLAGARLEVPIYVFEGNSDVHTPPRFVRQLEAWNEAHGHLDLRVRYYDGAHGGTPEVQREVSELLMRLASADTAQDGGATRESAAP
jgi:hypothetical protein